MNVSSLERFLKAMRVRLRGLPVLCRVAYNHHMNDSGESMKVGPLYVPKNPQRLAAWMIGNGTFAFFVYWTADSFFPQRELTAEAMIVKLISAGLSFAVGLWLMHINHN